MKKTFEQDLLDLAKFPYQSRSHAFNRASLAAYGNVLNYGIDLHEDFIKQPLRESDHAFLLNSPELFPSTGTEYERENSGQTMTGNKTKRIQTDRSLILYSEQEQTGWKKIIDTIYNLNELFLDENIQKIRSSRLRQDIRRGMRFADRPEIGFYDNDGKYTKEIYNAWVESKLANPKVFRRSFLPVRYLRSFGLQQYGYNVIEKLYTINDIPYALINFHIEGEHAWELAFFSKYMVPGLKVMCSTNEFIIISSLFDLYKKGIKTVNIGPAADLKGLEAFKHKFPYQTLTYYKKKIK